MHTAIGWLDRRGIGINPYMVYREALRAELEEVPFDYSIDRITLDNCESVLVDIAPEQEISPEDWKCDLQAGKLALAMRAEGELVGYTWASLRHFAPYQKRTELGPEQAYVTNTYVLKNFRCRGMASLLKQAMNRELLQYGRKEIISVTDLLNKPAMNLKRRIDATPLELRLALRISRWWHTDLRLRSFSTSASRQAAISSQSSKPENLSASSIRR
ncbi:MAG: GNAT family N-acetyltransferase [Gammaproteobacteria bacterium]